MASEGNARYVDGTDAVRGSRFNFEFCIAMALMKRGKYHTGSMLKVQYLSILTINHLY